MVRGNVAVDTVELRGAAALLLAGGLAVNVMPGEQGLPCPLRTLTGIPCPLCGMTTSVTATLEGDVSEALAANPAGVLAVAIAVLLVVGVLSRRRLVALPAWLVPVGLGVLWLFELNRFGVI